MSDFKVEKIIPKICMNENFYSYCSTNKVIDGVSVVLAPNPKDYTGPGTNTHIVGHDQVWIIDPGPHDSDHIAAVLRAVNGRDVRGIVVTHSHLDHSPAAQPLAEALGVRIYGGPALDGDLVARTDEEVDTDYAPTHQLSDGEVLGQDMWRLKAIHTPGHFPNHFAYYLPYLDILFSGDHVMGWSTTVVVPPLGNLPEYMDSLRKLGDVGADLMLPSHGAPIEDPTARLTEIIEHRAERHHQITGLLRLGYSSAASIVDRIYTDLSPRLYRAAVGQVSAHLECLDQQDALFTPLDPTLADSE